MNTLSVLSIIAYSGFFAGALQIFTGEKRNIVNISAAGVLVCLGWWSFCNSFFFATVIVEDAFFWHKLSSIGWCGLVAMSGCHFLTLTADKKSKARRNIIIVIFAMGLLLIVKNLFGETTSIATGLVVAQNGQRWTYVNSFDSIWLWSYLVYIFGTFAISFYYLSKWSIKIKHKIKKKLAVEFIVIDLITIFIGFITDVLLPIYYPVIPAVASIFTVLFGVGYFGIIKRYDIFNIDVVISSKDILEISSNAFFVLDENAEILKCNKAAIDLLGYDNDEIIGKNIGEFINNKLDFSYLSFGKELEGEEIEVIAKNGESKVVLISTAIVRDDALDFICVIASCHDITKQIMAQHELVKQQNEYKLLAEEYRVLAYYDTLTELPNRRMFFELLDEFEARYKSVAKDFCVIFMDLDGFKNINDIYGHKVGDDVLRIAANRLRDCLCNGDIAFRLGGDEFVILMEIEGKGRIDCKVESIHSKFREKMVVDDMSFAIGMSVGVSIYSEEKCIDGLVQKADERMYNQKNNKKIGNNDSIIRFRK
ncbi:MAG: sensor domain-containing diguanylate cyclase [Anaerovoracaceae bacterium]